MLCGTPVAVVTYDGVGGMRSVLQIFLGMSRLATSLPLLGWAKLVRHSRLKKSMYPASFLHFIQNWSSAWGSHHGRDLLGNVDQQADPKSAIRLYRSLTYGSARIC
jgi:hypothetical protein